MKPPRVSPEAIAESERVAPSAGAEIAEVAMDVRTAMELLMRATVFASQKHAGQLRAGGKNIPYINHPIEVAHRVTEVGGSLEAACGAVLHDVIEDCEVTAAEILALFADHRAFGQRVLQIVEEHTDPPGLSYSEIKQRETEMMATGQYLHDTKLVIIADQLCNMTDLVRTPPKWGNGEEETYIEQMKTLVKACRGTSPSLEQKFDEVYGAAKSFYAAQ